MKAYLGIIAICLLVVVELQAKAAPRIRKRSTKEETLPDPSGCIKDCTLNIPKVLDDPVYNNHMVSTCFTEKFSTNCINKCPDSKSKSLLLEKYVHVNTLCDASSADIAMDSACVDKILESINQTCITQCHHQEYRDVLPEVFADFAGEGAKNAIVVVLEKDANVVSKNIPEFCRQEKCMIDCQREPVTKECGQHAADRYFLYYGLWVKSLSKIYIDLNVVSADHLADCENIISN